MVVRTQDFEHEQISISAFQSFESHFLKNRRDDAIVERKIRRGIFPIGIQRRKNRNRFGFIRTTEERNQ